MDWWLSDRQIVRVSFPFLSFQLDRQMEYTYDVYVYMLSCYFLVVYLSPLPQKKNLPGLLCTVQFLWLIASFLLCSMAEKMAESVALLHTICTYIFVVSQNNITVQSRCSWLYLTFILLVNCLGVHKGEFETFLLVRPQIKIHLILLRN